MLCKRFKGLGGTPRHGDPRDVCAGRAGTSAKSHGSSAAQQLRRRVNKNRHIGSADAKTVVSHLGQGEKRQQKVHEQQRKSPGTPNGLAPAGTFGGCHPKWHWGARNWGEQWDSQLDSTSKILRTVSQGEDDLSCCQMGTRSRTTVLANTKNFMLRKVFMSMLGYFLTCFSVLV